MDALSHQVGDVVLSLAGHGSRHATSSRATSSLCALYAEGAQVEFSGQVPANRCSEQPLAHDPSPA